MNVNSLQRKKKPSEMMGEYVAGRNRVNAMPHQMTGNYRQPVSQGQARVAEIARQGRQQQMGVPEAPRTPAEIVGYQQAQRQQAPTSTPRMGGTVLTQEQILANNINDIIKQMNNIMSQPGNMLAPSMSPYYNIYMEQYRKNAEAAEANAFARSVASTGGYGSSYATMAGQQAYRETMDDFTELTPSLVQTKGQAMSDLMAQYQLAKGLKDNLELESDTETSTFKMADGTEIEVSNEARSIYNDIVEKGSWDGTNTEALKARLRNLGHKEADIDTAISMLKQEADIQTKEMQDKNLAAIEKGMEDISMIDLKQFGYKEKDIEKMDEDEYAAKAKEAWLANAADMVKSGQLSKGQFANVVEKDMVAGVDEILKGDTKYALRDISKYIIALDDYQTEGVLSTDFKTQIMGEIAKKVKKSGIYKEMMPFLGENGSILKEDLEKAEQVIALDRILNLQNDEQREALNELLKLKV